jgi:hypothetical protein
VRIGSHPPARRSPDPRLASLLQRELVGYGHAQTEFHSWLEPPRASLTLNIDLDGSLLADGSPLPAAWIGGLGDTYTVVGVGPRHGSIDLKLDPLGAYSLLGMPLSELGGACVAVDSVFGAAGRSLAERLPELEDWDARFDLLARFREQVGLPPKTVARLLRFADVRQRIERDPGGWADIAFAAGYADQSHLIREFQQLAGTTPTDFVARLMPGGGLVGDGCPSAGAA